MPQVFADVGQCVDAVLRRVGARIVLALPLGIGKPTPLANEFYRRALREAGMEVDDKLVFQAGRGIEDGAKATLQMIEENCGATAVQAVNDLVAIGAAWGWSIAGTFVILKVVNLFVPLRVHEDEEILGLDLSQHGEPAYASINAN